MRVLFLFLSFSLLWSCKSDKTPQTTAPIKELPAETKKPEKTAPTEVYCYLATHGTDDNYKDTTSVKLTIIGNEVMGTYNWIPAGKDSAISK